METCIFDKGSIRALTIHAEPILIAHLVDKDLFAVASGDSLETQTAGKSRKKDPADSKKNVISSFQ